VLVLDEPTASLDAEGQAELVRLLAGLVRGGRTLLLSSHRSEEIAALARRVVVLHEGRVQRIRAVEPRDGSGACEGSEPCEGAAARPAPTARRVLAGGAA
jgi:energy-coupling factor transporter ATP-binding protein EcfA2